MEYTLFPANERGYGNYGWLRTAHTFSFGDYYDPSKIHFGPLRVINDDIIAPGAGFDTHPHHHMEIITLPLSGALRHEDSSGGAGVIRAGDVQVMSAGTGVEHSEYNASSTDPVSLLQIWIRPNVSGVAPRYDQKTLSFSPQDSLHKPIVVGKSHAQEGDIWIYQDMFLFWSTGKAGEVMSYEIAQDRCLFYFVVEGSVSVWEHILQRRDGLGLRGQGDVLLTYGEESSILLFDMADTL